MTRFVATGSWGLNNDQAQVVGEELERIEQESGGNYSPKDVVEAATPTDSPLHGFFEWKDEEAAAAHRVNQARALIRSVKVVVTSQSGEEKVVRAFVSIKDRITNKPKFVSIGVALSEADYREQVLTQALSDLQAWQKKYADLKELAGVFAVADTLRAMLK